jgi:hypothetical protein
MAISGSFQDVQFSEVLRIVAKRTGRLWIYNFSSNLYSEWFIHQDVVYAVRLNKKSLMTDEEVFNAAAKLSEDVTCSYIFYTLTLDRIPSEILLPISMIGLQTVKTNVPVQSEEEMLPNPETMFVATPKAVATNIPDELRDFWRQSGWHSGEKYSANTIADKTGRDVRTVQLNLSKLRALGLIRPFRAIAAATVPALNGVEAVSPKSFNHFQTNPSTDAASDSVSTLRRGLIQRMLEAIRAK